MATAELDFLLRADPVRVREVIEAAIPKAKVHAYRSGMVALRRRMERPQTRKLMPILKQLGDHVADVAASKGGLVEAVSTRDAKAREIAHVNAIVKAAELPKWRQEHMLDWIETLYAGAFAGEYSLAQPGLDATVRNTIERAVLKRAGTNLGLIDLTDHTKSSLFRVLEFAREWEVGKPSPRQVATWIRNEVPAGRFVNAGAKYRAELIARTEIMNATRVSSIETARANPLVSKLTAFDGDMDEQCALRNGNDFTPDEADIETASTHPNCTLMFVPAYTP